MCLGPLHARSHSPGAGWGGSRAWGEGAGRQIGLCTFNLPASGHIPKEPRPGHPTLHRGAFSKLHFAGQLGGVTQHLCATPRPQPPHSGGYSTNACHSLTWERCIFSKPQVNQSETGLLPILNLYGGFLPELACAHTH